MDIKVPHGSPIFQKGYKDGCGTVIYARGNQLYRDKYSYQYDPALIGNVEYRFGHQRGYTACFQYYLAGPTGPLGSWERVMLLNNHTFDTSRGDIGAAWGGFFGGTAGKGLGETIGDGFNPIFGAWAGGSTIGGSSSGVLSSNPLWAGGSGTQIFGQ